jgi:hypothetical protein
MFVFDPKQTLGDTSFDQRKRRLKNPFFATSLIAAGYPPPQCPANHAEAEQHHCPGGGFGDSASVAEHANSNPQISV